MSTVSPVRTAAITGGSGGIGAETALALATQLPSLSRLVLCCRDVKKGERVANQVRQRNGSLSVDIVQVELANVTSIKSCAKELGEIVGDDNLDLLVCNAGIMAPGLGFAENDEIGEDYKRIEKQFFVNHLSHALMVDRLMDKLEGGRVVFVSSTAVGISRQRLVAPTISEKTANVITDSNYSRWLCYGDSKLAMSLYAKALAKHANVESVSLHPGVVQTELGRFVAPWAIREGTGGFGDVGFVGEVLSWFGLKTPKQGAMLSVELSSAKKGGFDNGDMYIGLGGKKATTFLIPLLQVEGEYNRVWDDAQKFVGSV